MAPGTTSQTHNGPSSRKDFDSFPTPLKLGNALAEFPYEDTTPVIGREFPFINIVNDLIHSENADTLLQDLAITISQRGVVFFRSQDNLTDELQKQLIHRLGQLSGKPTTSTLHVHPVLNNTSEFGVGDAQISHISSVARKKMFKTAHDADKRRYDNALWHSDIAFEPVPADYTSLRVTKLPSTGGDTMWASGYEVYDRFSKPYQKFFETLTCTFTGASFEQAAREDPEHVKIHEAPRGSPQNIGPKLSAVHPVVRTNPVTGWKSIFSIGSQAIRINELNRQESDELLKRFLDMIQRNHDLQVRFKWRNPNDFAIWDNRSVFHCATFDYDGLGERFGNRAVGIGEPPFFNPDSMSRTEALSKEA